MRRVKRAEKRDQRVLRNQSGQTVFEFTLILAMVVTCFYIVAYGLKRLRFQEQMMKPISEEFAMAYKYGHPKAKGLDEGAPEFQIRFAEGGGDNFRVFLNPRMK